MYISKFKTQSACILIYTKMSTFKSLRPYLYLICIGLAKTFLQFLGKNKRHIFHFHQELYWTTYSLLCSTAAAATSLQSCLTLWDPIDSSPPGTPIPGILQARTLEWVAISFSDAWKWKVKVKSLSRVWLFEVPWTAAHQAPPSMGFSRQEYWSGVPLLSYPKCLFPNNNNNKNYETCKDTSITHAHKAEKRNCL